MKFRILLILIFPLLVSCVKQQSPQLPANKKSPGESTSSKLMQLNQRLISGEDSVLRVYVNKLDSGFIKSKMGFWYKIDHHNNGRSIVKKDVCLLDLSVYDLKHNFLLIQKQKITIGKKQTLSSLEELVKHMKRGETASVILPWYLAYGMKGYNGVIDPYTSLLIYLRVE